MTSIKLITVHVKDLKNAALWYAIHEYDRAHTVPLPMFAKDRLELLVIRFRMFIHPVVSNGQTIWRASCSVPKGTGKRVDSLVGPFDAAIRAALATYKTEWEVPEYMMQSSIAPQEKQT